MSECSLQYHNSEKNKTFSSIIPNGTNCVQEVFWFDAFFTMWHDDYFYATFSNQMTNWATFVKTVLFYNVTNDTITFSNILPNWTTFVKEGFWFALRENDG